MHKLQNLLPSGLLALAVLVLALPGVVFAAAPSELHITTDGKFAAKNLVVMQKSENGATFFVRAQWGEVYLRLTVLSAPSGVAAKITKNNGGAGTYQDVAVGDVLNVEGTLSPGADTLLIQATNIVDLALNIEEKSISGTIKTVSGNATTLLDKKLGTITVIAPSSITKGARTIAPAELVVGDKILSASGTFDYSAKTLIASSMEVYQDKSIFLPKNFEGVLKSVSSTALPTTLVITVGKQDYTVYFAAGASVMSKNKSTTSLQRFTVGDRVRFYGSVRPINLSEIDASSLRNLNF